jgi:hypothetical protein
MRTSKGPDTRSSRGRSHSRRAARVWGKKKDRNLEEEENGRKAEFFFKTINDHSKSIKVSKMMVAKS